LREHSPNSVYQPFKEFQSMYRKKAALGTMRQLFGHQLRQVQGCSTSVAATLMNKYGTTARFMQELDYMGMAKAEVRRMLCACCVRLHEGSSAPARPINGKLTAIYCVIAPICSTH
jgi:hypothetical protein